MPQIIHGFFFSLTLDYVWKAKQAHYMFLIYFYSFLRWKLDSLWLTKYHGKFDNQWWSGTAILDDAVILLCRKEWWLVAVEFLVQQQQKPEFGGMDAGFWIQWHCGTWHMVTVSRGCHMGKVNVKKRW